MTKSTEKVNKTTKIEMRCTEELKAMAKAKAKRAGFNNRSAWIEKLIRRSR